MQMIPPPLGSVKRKVQISPGFKSPGCVLQVFFFFAARAAVTHGRIQSGQRGK